MFKLLKYFLVNITIIFMVSCGNNSKTDVSSNFNSFKYERKNIVKQNRSINILPIAVTKIVEANNHTALQMGGSTLKVTQEQYIGIRYSNLSIPNGATITNAYLKFQSNKTSNTKITLNITTEDNVNAEPFLDNIQNIIARRDTIDTFIQWTLPKLEQFSTKTTDLKTIIQPLVSKTNWKLDHNAIVFIISGKGEQVTNFFNSDNLAEPLLYIEYIMNIETKSDIKDTNISLITLNGDNPIHLNLNDTFVDPGFSINNLNAHITKVETNNNIDTSTEGEYQLTYKITDQSGNLVEITRDIIVSDNNKQSPTIQQPNNDTPIIEQPSNNTPTQPSSILYGGKKDNSGDGNYYKWDDNNAIRGLKFDAHQDFILKSVKVYNQISQADTRVFTIKNSAGEIIANKALYIKEGEQRIPLNMKVPKGNGYTLIADNHKGLYKNNKISDFPYEIGDIVTITGSDIDQTHYYFFYDWEIEIANLAPSPYIPTTLDFSKNDVYENINNKKHSVIEVNSTNELNLAIFNAQPYTTIILNDGEYRDVHIEFKPNQHHITIKAKGDNALIIPKGHAIINPLHRGITDSNFAFNMPNTAQKESANHHINFVALTVKGDNNFDAGFIKSINGRWVDELGQLHDYGNNNPKYGPHHIYFYKMKFKNLFMGLYSGIYAHDWSVDSCYFGQSTYSHFWYMMGWHLSIINSTLEDATHDALTIRGYYPEGEVWTYIDPDANATTECYGNVLVEDREIRLVTNGFLPTNDWTHLIKNNTFKRITSIRNKENDYINISYGFYDNDPYCGAERVYMPPQNIEISNNYFSNENEKAESYNSCISINAWSGIYNDSLASINGIKVHDNKFIPIKNNENFIYGESTGDYPKPDITKIEQYNNILTHSP